MAKRLSPEGRIINYFASQPLATAKVLLSILRDQVRTRESNLNNVDEGLPPAHKVRRKRSPRKALGAAASSTPHPVSPAPTVAQVRNAANSHGASDMDPDS